MRKICIASSYQLQSSSRLLLFFAKYVILTKLCRCDGMVDVTDSKSVGGNTVWVRVPPPAPNKSPDLSTGQIRRFLFS